MVGSRELKTRLGSYLRRVRAGETLVVSDRGVPIAELKPLPKPASGWNAHLRRLAAEGWVTLPTRKGFRPIEPVRLKGGASLSKVVLEDREDRF